MMSANRIAGLVLTLLLGACATTPPKPAAAAQPGEAQAAGTAAEQPEAKPELVAEDESRYPKQALTPDLLFKMLLGDVAAAKGDRPLAAESWFRVAQETRDPRAAKRALEVAFGANNYELALASCQLWRELEPNSTIARQTLLTLLLRGNKLDAAEKEWGAWLGENPKDAPALLLQMHNLWPNDADKQAVLAVTHRLAGPYASIPEANMAIAMAEHDAGHDDAAVKLADKAIAGRPDWTAAILYRAALTQEQTPDAAIEYLQAALKRQPQTTDIKVALARLLSDAKQYPQARTLFIELGHERPDDVEFPVGEALSDLQLHEYAASAQALERALQLNPKRPAVLRYYLGVCAEEQGQFAKARDWYRQVSEPDYQVQTATRLAHVEARLGERDAALAELEKLPNDSQADQIAHLQIEAQVWRELKDYGRARAVLDDGLAHHADNADLLYDRSLIFDQMGDVVSAERDLRRYLSLNPENPTALNALGYTLANRTTRYDEAEPLIRRALEKEPENPVIQDSLGWLMVKRGNYPEALKWLSQAFNAMPDPEIAAHYGEALWRSGQQSAARKIWAEGRKLDPQHDVLAETMHRLTGQ